MLEAHPFADLFPMLGADDGAELRTDIAAHGLRDRVVLFEGQILDGRNRYRALTEIAKLGLTLRGRPLTAVDLTPGVPGDIFEQFAGTESEALEYVLSKNLHRRHLNESQRAMVAANLANLKPGRPDANKAANLRDYRQIDAAERLHVSERSVQDARVVRERGIDDINEAVQRGDLAVSAAAQLARLPADEQARIIRETADPKALSRVAKELRAEKQAEKAVRREAREQALGAKQRALPQKRYGVILADPEWRYEVWSEATGRDRSPDNHYPTSLLDDIRARRVIDIAADDSVLVLWVPVPLLVAGLTVMSDWGFVYVTHLAWIKERPGRARGTGFWFTGEHEVVLVGKRGTPPAPTPGTQFPSFFRAPVTEHSAKPDNVHQIIEAYFPSLPKIELNARRRRPGWDVWGLEADGGDDERSDHETHDAQDGARPGVLAVDGAEASPSGEGSAGSLGEGVPLPVAELAPAACPRRVRHHPPGQDSPQAELTGNPDAEIIAAIGEPVRRVLEKREMFGFMRVGAVGIIPIEGTLVRKGAFLGQSSGETSYEGLSAQVARAMDPAVRGVAFEVDSFGGMANGAFALADQIHELSQVKPTIAILTDFAMSAAYLLASQCRQIVMPRQGAAGSIGVITMHVDRSAAVEQSGLKVTVVKSGAKKDQGSSLGPLADDYLARLQASVDATRDEFAAVVARGRGARLTKAAALATEADWFEGETAVAAGLVDHIADPQRAFEAFAAAIHAANPGA